MVADPNSGGKPKWQISGTSHNIDFMAGSTFTGPLRIRKSDGTKVEFVDADGDLVAGTSIKFGDGESIVDTNDNELLKFSVTASAVNEFTVSNAATGNAPVIYATGGDTNIDIGLVPKGTGVVEVYTEQAGATGASFTLNQNSASPAADDNVGVITFAGRDSDDEPQNYARIVGGITDPTADSERGYVGFLAANASGVLAIAGYFDHDGTNGGLYVGDNTSAGLISTYGDNDLVLQTGNETTGSITITDGADGNIALAPNGAGKVTVTATGIATTTANTLVPVMFTAATEVIAAGNPGAISVATYATHISADAGGDAFTLASGTVIGQRKRIYFLATAGGTGVVTGAFRGTNNTLTFTNAGEYAELIWDGTDWLDIELGSTNDTNIATPPALSEV